MIAQKEKVEEAKRMHKLLTPNWELKFNTHFIKDGRTNTLSTMLLEQAKLNLRPKYKVLILIANLKYTIFSSVKSGIDREGTADESPRLNKVGEWLLKKDAIKMLWIAIVDALDSDEKIDFQVVYWALKILGDCMMDFRAIKDAISVFTRLETLCNNKD